MDQNGFKNISSVESYGSIWLPQLEARAKKRHFRLNTAELPVLPPKRVKFGLPSLSILFARFLRPPMAKIGIASGFAQEEQ